LVQNSLLGSSLTIICQEISPEEGREADLSAGSLDNNRLKAHRHWLSAFHGWYDAGKTYRASIKRHILVDTNGFFFNSSRNTAPAATRDYDAAKWSSFDKFAERGRTQRFGYVATASTTRNECASSGTNTRLK